MQKNFKNVQVLRLIEKDDLAEKHFDFEVV